MAKPEDLSRGQNVYMAKLAEKVERYEDMAKYMNKLVRTTAASGSELTLEERNLLSVAYKKVVDSLRVSWLTGAAAEQKEVLAVRKNVVRDYRSKVESELSEVCATVLNLLDDYLLPSAVSNESKVLYLKMKGDYYRYLAEFKSGDERKSAADDAKNAYNTALETAAVADLPCTHPVRLALALNLSVLYYEVLNEGDKGCAMAELALGEALTELDTLGDDYYKDSTMIIKLLRDNVNLWREQQQQDNSSGYD